MKNRVRVKYFVNGYLLKQFLASNLPLALSNLMCLAIFVTLKSEKLETLICKKALKFNLHDNCLPNILTKVHNWYRKPFTFGIRRFFSKSQVNSSEEMTTFIN